MTAGLAKAFSNTFFRQRKEYWVIFFSDLKCLFSVYDNTRVVQTKSIGTKER